MSGPTRSSPDATAILRHSPYSIHLVQMSLKLPRQHYRTKEEVRQWRRTTCLAVFLRALRVLRW